MQCQPQYILFTLYPVIFHSVDGQTICVIDPAYEDQVKEKVTKVFSFLGESGVNSLFEKIKAVLEDEKMVRTTLGMRRTILTN